MSNDPKPRSTIRERLCVAAVSGLSAGAVRAMADWLLRHFT